MVSPSFTPESLYTMEAALKESIFPIPVEWLTLKFKPINPVYERTMSNAIPLLTIPVRNSFCLTLSGIFSKNTSLSHNYRDLIIVDI